MRGRLGSFAIANDCFHLDIADNRIDLNRINLNAVHVADIANHRLYLIQTLGLSEALASWSLELHRPPLARASGLRNDGRHHIPFACFMIALAVISLTSL
ncbi:hypothetical protein SDC9_150478 [bioreactor metagenome]|uniref:Uncharacterized protein n=1 Tax=bioreactor metagenome TaxID=1076179 RepID=A0A645EML3_9ZZZZ